MNEVHKFEQEIDLLGQDTSDVVPKPHWLVTEYSEPIWSIDLGEAGVRSLDFRKRLEDGSLLTNSRNAALLRTFKQWIVESVDRKQHKWRPSKGASLRRRLSVVLELIDYFLVRASEVQLSKFGLSLVTANDIRVLMEELCENSCSSLTIYRWPSLLKAYLDQGSKLAPCEALLTERPFLSREYVSEDEYLLPASRTQVSQYRAFLWSRGYYKKRYGSADGSYSLNTVALSRVVLGNTMKGWFRHPKPPELEIGAPQLPVRDAKAIPVKASGPRPLPRKEAARYAASLRVLADLEHGPVGFSIDDVEVARKSAINNAIGSGRFRTLPHDVVVHALRNSLEFYLRYGEDLLEAYVMCCSLKMRQPRVSMDQAASSVFSKPRFTSLKEVCSAYWSSGRRMTQCAINSGLPSEVNLYELLMVLFGAIHITIGALSARRIGELLSTPVDKCLDASGTLLVFQNRKTGEGSYRSKELRPIPAIATRMIRAVQKFQGELIEIGCLQEFRSVVAYPLVPRPGLVTERTVITQKHLDYFCDYFEVPGEAPGTRFYIRTHQLRRFFAMAFFWSGTPSGEDTLSWFLGHTDPEHLYHYISEEISGQVLRSVQASTIVELARQDSGLKAELEDLVRRYFGVAKLILLTASELSDYLEALLEEEIVEVEPHFFDTADGKKYRMCVKISEPHG